MPRPATWLCLGMLLAALAFLPACSTNSASGDSAKPAARPLVPVTVGTVRQENIPVEIDVIGTGQAYSTVSIKSLVQGEVQKVYFRQGQYVHRGQLLYSIDSAPFEAALAQAKANLAKDKAQLQFAQAQSQRYTDLFKQGIVSQDQYDQFHSSAAQTAATVSADEAAVQNATIQLGYCTIRSPLDGLTGALQVDQGNLVKVNDVAMVVINQIEPIYINFSVPQQYLQPIKDEQAKRQLRVQAVIPHEPDEPEWGKLTFINNTVDASTGTIMLKGTFPNPHRRLWPGQFVNIVLDLSEQPNAVVAPSPAVQTGQSGHYVYVVDSNNSVAYKPVTIGANYKGDTVIEKGLQPGETVVTDGQLLLYPGAKVVVKPGL
ncbi:MAG: efflux RND transporter periplasmic adaptor subunit [Acidobacteriota bacterium]|nr:efflux RND transporter periplasmic adaptor subunit [Acidobacteriota bacterium]